MLCISTSTVIISVGIVGRDIFVSGVAKWDYQPDDNVRSDRPPSFGADVPETQPGQVTNHSISPDQYRMNARPYIMFILRLFPTFLLAVPIPDLHYSLYFESCPPQ